MTRLSAILLLVYLGGCASAPDEANGCIAYSPAVPLVASLGRVCAVQLDQHWAVSVKHGTKVLNAALVPSELVRSDDYDLVFFRHEGPAPEWASHGETQVIDKGEGLSASGNPDPPMRTWGKLAQVVGVSAANHDSAIGTYLGKVWWCGEKEEPTKCAWAIAFNAPVQPGYSGGPVVDFKGRIVGITVASITSSSKYESGTGVALPAGLVWAEFHRLVKQ